MIIYNNSSNDSNLSNKNQTKSKFKRNVRKYVKVRTSRNKNKKLKVTKKNQLYLQSIGLKLKK